MTEQVLTGRTRDVVVFLDRLILSFTRHWLLILSLILGVWVVLPWLAPVLMAAGWERGAHLVYLLYSPQCHQLPQRSYFLFGPRLMYPMADINAAWPYIDSFRLRQFIGTPAMGYKIAWSDRMVSLYTPLFVGAVLFALAPLALAQGTTLAAPLDPLVAAVAGAHLSGRRYAHDRRCHPPDLRLPRH